MNPLQNHSSCLFEEAAYPHLSTEGGQSATVLGLGHSNGKITLKFFWIEMGIVGPSLSNFAQSLETVLLDLGDNW
jgi:hypothetical protein